MAPASLANVERLFTERLDVVMTTGTVIADGIHNAGFDFPSGKARLAAHPRSIGPETLCNAYNGYGCNMAIRGSTVLAHDLQFDESLPLYGWLEDVDFSRRLAEHGQILRSSALVGVHLGTKGGRTSGVRLGYSQIANPLYLIRKGTMAPRRAYRLMAQNLARNLTRSWRPEPWIDRRGRLRGNLTALADLLRGRLQPARALDLG
ncbi:glycosyltransferase family 2 protein [Thioclava sp. BHET1]|nr:glycosyltransferase family 2 protein [Thioclava sp. BHET1]